MKRANELPKATEKTLQTALMRWALDRKNHVLALPNIGALYGHEADLITMTRAGLIHEFEIKLTIHDYRRDFAESPADRKWRKWRKHHYMALAHEGDKRALKLPNYFWFATNGFEIEDLPAYAGWVRVGYDDRWGKWRVAVEQAAPRLHRDKALEAKDRDALTRWLSYKLKNAYSRLYLH